MITSKIKNEVASNELKYPCLMQLKDSEHMVIVLMDKCGHGMTLYSSDKNGYKEGEYYSHWEMRHFIKFNGSITVQNA